MTSPSRKNREKFHRKREKLQLSARLGLEYRVYVLLNVAMNFPLYKIFIDSKGIFFSLLQLFTQSIFPFNSVACDRC